MREYTCRHKDKNGRDNDNRIRQKFHEKYRSKKNEEEKEIKNEVEKIMIVIIRDIREKKKEWGGLEVSNYRRRCRFFLRFCAI